jgi:hypothetical protein
MISSLAGVDLKHFLPTLRGTGIPIGLGHSVPVYENTVISELISNQKAVVRDRWTFLMVIWGISGEVASGDVRSFDLIYSQGRDVMISTSICMT